MKRVLLIWMWLPVMFAAAIWRSLMRRTTFIAITGSFGKTAAKDCLAAILSQAGATVKTRHNSNGRQGVANTLLRVRPWHRFAVLEVGTDYPGNLLRGSMVIRPDVVLVLGVGRTHTSAFRDLAQTAREKESLARFMRRKGILVLNADDPRVNAMAGGRTQRVVRFGSSADCDARAADVTAEWPGRLSFSVQWAEERRRMETQLVGEHWLASALGAVATARALGVGLEEAAAGLATVEPFAGRLQPVTLPNGAVVLCDDFNGSVESFDRAMEVLRTARAGRRILVIGDCSDFRKKPRERMAYFARAARTSAEMVIFVGERCEYGVARATREGMPPGAAHGFYGWSEAAEFLRGELRSGDLVLLRGQNRDHLGRICFSLLGTVGCVKVQCGLRIACDHCPDLRYVPTPEKAG